MEIISGGELFNRIVEKEKYNEREARVAMIQLATAIAYAHNKRIAHRDLKPENILLKSKDDDTAIKLADLGFAKILKDNNEKMMTPCGTPGYVAPEVISGKAYGLPCDIWSLGVIFYILLCGYPPFDAEDQAVLFKQIKAADYKFDPADWSVVSDAAKDLIRKMLLVDPNARLTAEQVRSGVLYCDDTICDTMLTSFNSRFVLQILQHPWMKMDAAQLPAVDLNNAKEQLRKYNARRRLVAAMRVVRATVRARMLMLAKVSREAAKEGREIDGFEELAKIAKAEVPTLPTTVPRMAPVSYTAAGGQFNLGSIMPPATAPRPGSRVFKPVGLTSVS